MNLKITKTKLDGVLKIHPNTITEDFRGTYVETYNKKLYNQLGINVDFVEDDISINRFNVLRGIHGDNKTYKLITCLYGSFYLVVVNNNPKSSQYKQWESFTLSDVNRLQILVPPYFGNGHLVLTKLSIFSYKQSQYYNRDGQFTIKWDDPMFNIFWPLKNPILSQRDLLI